MHAASKPHLPSHYRTLRDHHMVGRKVAWSDLVKVVSNRGTDYDRVNRCGTVLAVDTTGQCALIACDDGSVCDIDLCEITAL